MPCNLEPNHISIPALQCLPCAMTSNILPPASTDVRPVAALAGAWKGEEKQHRAWKGGSVRTIFVNNFTVAVIRNAAQLSSTSMDLLSLTLFTFLVER